MIWLSPRAQWVLALFIAIPMLATTGWQASNAAAAEAAAAKKKQRVAAQAEELHTLRAGLPAWARSSAQRSGGENSESMAQRVSAAIAAAGLPATALSSVSPESHSGAAGSATAGKSAVGIDRRKTTLTFSTLTLPQVGRFLSTWREREPAWVVTSIDATPEQRAPSERGAQQTQPGGDLPVRIVLVVESLSVRLPKAVGSTPARPGSLLPAPRASSSSSAPSTSTPPITPAPSTTKPSAKRQGDSR